MVIFIVAILAGLGIPSLQNSLERRAVKAEANRLIRSINFARSEAVNKQQIVGLERVSITPNDWSEGWRVYSTPSNNLATAYDAATDTLLQDITGISAQAVMVGKTAAANRIKFNRFGRLVPGTGAAVTIAVCDPAQNTGVDGSMISINLVGRATTSVIPIARKAADC